MSHELLSLRPETCHPERRWFLRRKVWVLAGLGLVAGMMFGPALLLFTCHSKPQIVKSVMAYRRTLFPQWVATHPGEECPRTIADLAPLVDRYSDKDDAWGTEYEVICVRGQRSGLRGLILRSAGPDQIFGTADDLSSDPLPAILIPR